MLDGSITFVLQRKGLISFLYPYPQKYCVTSSNKVSELIFDGYPTEIEQKLIAIKLGYYII